MLIRMKDLSKVYPIGDGQLSVLKRINLEINAGEFIAIMGRSGSGKSSLLHLLGCLDLPTSGTYELKGRLITALGDKELSSIRNKQIGFIFQTFNLIPQLNVLENVEVPIHYSGVVRRERRKSRFRFIKRVGLSEKRRSLQLIEKVGLLERIHHTPPQLSGGEMQRVAIARALVNDPPLLLADEPTGNLDTATSAGIMELVAELNRQGRTVIMVTHDDTVAAYAKTVLHLQDGVLER
jgi:putative ABC transport system ATP-binding protein